MLNNIGKLYTDMADWQRATGYYKQALALPVGNSDWRRQAVILGNLGNSIAHTDSQAAIDYHERALKLWRAMGERSGEAQALANVASIRLNSGKTAEAVDGAEQALAIYRDVGNRAGEARTLRAVGWAHAKRGEVERGLGFLEEAIAADLKIGDRREQSLALAAREFAQSLAGQPKQSRESYREAAEIAGQIGESHTLARSLHGIAMAERDLGNPAEAQHNIEGSLDLIENVRTNSGGEQARAGYLSETLERYEFYIDLLMRQHHEAQAFEASERSRAQPGRDAGGIGRRYSRRR